MYSDHEFDPVTPEELAERERDEELARKIRREVLRMQRGEADEELRADAEREAAEREESERSERRERRRRSSALWQLLSGSILVRKGSGEYYRYLICIAAMFFLSIVVMFASLHLDMRCSRLAGEVQLLRERAYRFEEERFRRTSRTAVREELRRRGIELYDPISPGLTIED